MMIYNLMLLQFTFFLLSLRTRAASVDILDPTEYQELVHDSRKAVIVWYWTKSIIDEKKEAIEGNIAERLVTYDLPMYAIDCSSKNCKVLCEDLPIPSMHLFVEAPTINLDTGKKIRAPIPYSGDGKYSNIEKFIIEHYPVPKIVESLTAYSSILDEMETDAAAVFFTESESLSLLLKSAAHHFSDVLTTIHVPLKTSRELSKYLKVTAAKIAVVKKLNKSRLINYGGSKKSREELIRWLGPYANPVMPDPQKNSEYEKGGSRTSVVKSPYGDWFRHSNTLQSDEDLPGDKSIILGIFSDDWAVQGNKLYDLWRTKIAPSCEGNVIPIEVVCTGEVNPNGRGLGKTLCSIDRVKDISGVNKSNYNDKTNSYAYLYFLPIQNVSKSFRRDASGVVQVRNMHTLSNYDKVLTTAFQSLPKRNIKYLKDYPAVKEFAETNSYNKQITVLAVSKKQEANDLLHNVAFTLSGIKSQMNSNQTIARFGFVSNLSEELQTNLGVTIAPAFITLHHDKDSTGELKVTRYNTATAGSFKHDSLIKFIKSATESAGAPYLPASWTPEQLETNLAFKDHPTKVYDVELLGEWSQLCPQAFRGACAIAFYSKDNRETEIEILVNASKHLSIAEDGKLAGMIQFMTVDPICQRSFSEIFGVVANDKPALIAYGPNNGLFTTLKGNFNSEDIIEMFLEMPRGKSRNIVWTELKKRPEITPLCEEVVPPHESKDHKVNPLVNEL